MFFYKHFSNFIHKKTFTLDHSDGFRQLVLNRFPALEIKLFLWPSNLTFCPSSLDALGKHCLLVQLTKKGFYIQGFPYERVVILKRLIYILYSIRSFIGSRSFVLHNGLTSVNTVLLQRS